MILNFLINLLTLRFRISQEYTHGKTNMASCAPQPKQEEEIPFEQPNFVIIFTDELAMADIGAYGG